MAWWDFRSLVVWLLIWCSVLSPVQAANLLKISQIQAWGENHRCHYPINASDPSGNNPILIGLAAAALVEAYNEYSGYNDELIRDSRVNQYGNWTAKPSGKGGYWDGSASERSHIVTAFVPGRAPSFVRAEGSLTLGAGLPGSDKIMAAAIKNSPTLTKDGFYNFFVHGAEDGSLWIKTGGKSIPVSPSQLQSIVQRGLAQKGLPADTPLQLNACFGANAIPALEQLGMKVRSWTGKIEVHWNGDVTPHSGTLPTP